MIHKTTLFSGTTLSLDSVPWSSDDSSNKNGKSNGRDITDLSPSAPPSDKQQVRQLLTVAQPPSCDSLSGKKFNSTNKTVKYYFCCGLFSYKRSQESGK